MTASAFLDTNVLVYPYDPSKPVKQKQAIELIGTLVAAHATVVSPQILGELFTTLSRKLKHPLSLDEARNAVAYYYGLCSVVDITGATVLEAMRGAREYQLHYWDAQIWAAARLAGVGLVFSEDFHDGAVLDGVRFVNPFRPGFRIADWL